MKLDYFVSQLAFLELANLSLVVEESGKIKDARQPHVVTAINSVLTELTSKYIVNTGITSLTVVPEVLEYDITAEGLVQIIYIYRYDAFTESTVEVYTGERRIHNGFTILNGKKILFNSPPKEQTYRIHYHKAHSLLNIDITKGDLLKQTIDIPFWLEECTRLGVAARIYGSMGGEQNMVLSRDFDGRYKAAQIELHNQGQLIKEVNYSGDVAKKNGFA